MQSALRDDADVKNSKEFKAAEAQLEVVSKADSSSTDGP